MKDFYIDNKNNTELENFVLPTDETELIFYWAKWCGVCQAIKPLWNKTKEDIINKYPNLKIKEIECDDPEKCFMYKDKKKEIIEGVPTIILRQQNIDKEYMKDDTNNILCNKESDDMLHFLNLYLEK